MGAFRIAITAGTFGATLVPFFIALLRAGGEKTRRLAILGCVAASAIVITSHASGPLMAAGSGILAWAIWPWRKRMQLIRRSMLCGLIGLHLIMNAPVWYLFSRAADLIGGGGWHRSYLIDQALHHFNSWWLMGTDDTGDWMPSSLAIDGTADLTNQFIVTGTRGGLLSMLLFIWIIVRCFRHLGIAMRNLREISPRQEILLWGLGAALFATVVNFFSISYFDQIEEIWYLLIAMISGAAFSASEKFAEHDAVKTIEPQVVPHSETAYSSISMARYPIRLI